MNSNDLDVVYNSLINEYKSATNVQIEHMKMRFLHIRVGRADPNLVSDLLVECYGERVKLKTIAQIQIPEPQKIYIKPFEKQSIAQVCKAINDEKLDVDVAVDADKIILTMRPLTQENRRETSKQVKTIGDETKQKLRYCRRDILQKWKKIEDKSKDIEKQFEAEIDREIKLSNKIVDQLVEMKEKEIMSMEERK